MGGRAAPDQWLMRYVPYNDSRVVPDWLTTSPPRPRVCLTMGSVMPAYGGVTVLAGLLAGLADLDVEIVLVLGDEVAGELGTVPGNVRVAGWVPLDVMLPSCAAIVHHGGAGTALTALARGVPQIVVARGADRPMNAAAVAARGVGVALDPATCTPDVLRDELIRLLADDGVRKTARGVSEEIAAQPSPARIAERLGDPTTWGNGHVDS
ncbi:DUF1205 domain-containing protein [Micromonospora sp. CPCC 205371]|nr:DUF1205 domain-containing protein [Micromonospora sp. CPCC 205371]